MSTTARPRKASQAAAPITALGGRLFIAVGIVAFMALLTFGPLTTPIVAKVQKAINWQEDKPVDMTVWKAGQPEEIEITLVTADYEKLACAYDKQVGDAHCEYKTEHELWPRDPSAPVDDNKKNVIQPYSAVPDNAFILLSGLWAQPEVAMRLHAEPPANVETKRLARFIAHCRVRPVERVDGVKIRWNKTDDWAVGTLRLADNRQVTPWVAVVEHCSVENE